MKKTIAVGNDQLYILDPTEGKDMKGTPVWEFLVKKSDGTETHLCYPSTARRTLGRGAAPIVSRDAGWPIITNLLIRIGQAYEDLWDRYTNPSTQS